jgi:hypothetical protein
VRVTHAFHPLFGQEFAFVTMRLTWGRWRVQYYEEVGVVRSLPASGTDAGAIDPFVVRAAGRSVLYVDDRVALIELVAGVGAGAARDA